MFLIVHKNTTRWYTKPHKDISGILSKFYYILLENLPEIQARGICLRTRLCPTPAYVPPYRVRRPQSPGTCPSSPGEPLPRPSRSVSEGQMKLESTFQRSELLKQRICRSWAGLSLREDGTGIKRALWVHLSLLCHSLVQGLRSPGILGTLRRHVCQGRNSLLVRFITSDYLGI